MARVTILVSIIFLLCGVAFHFLTHSNILPNADKDAQEITKLSLVVTASKDIASGELFSTENVIGKDVDTNDLTQDSLTNPEVLFERRSNKAIEKGSQISVADIVDEDRFKWNEYNSITNQEAIRQVQSGYVNVVYPIRDIPEGERISALDLEQKRVKETVSPVGILQSTIEINGRIAKYGLSQGQYITKFDLREKE